MLNMRALAWVGENRQKRGSLLPAPLWRPFGASLWSPDWSWDPPGLSGKPDSFRQRQCPRGLEGGEWGGGSHTSSAAGLALCSGCDFLPVPVWSSGSRCTSSWSFVKSRASLPAGRPWSLPYWLSSAKGIGILPLVNF